MRLRLISTAFAICLLPAVANAEVMFDMGAVTCDQYLAMSRFMPKADQRTLTMAAIWLVGQCVVFVRNREQLANPPVSLDLDDATVAQLTALVSAWALAGLADAESKTVPAPY